MVKISPLSQAVGIVVSSGGMGSGSQNSGQQSGDNTGQNTNRQYTISVTSANTAQGTVSGGGTYSEGSRINISATAKAGYAFDKWSDGNTSASRTVVMNANTTLVASFKEQTQGGGTDTGDDDNETYI